MDQDEASLINQIRSENLGAFVSAIGMALPKLETTFFPSLLIVVSALYWPGPGIVFMYFIADDLFTKIL
jgi:hypothetical protein